MIQQRRITGRGRIDGTRMRLLLFLLIFSTVSITLSAIYGDGGYFQYRSLCAYRDTLREEITELENQVSVLERELQELGDEEFRVEKLAREEFGLSLPGEIIIYFSEDEFAGLKKD